MRIRSSFRAHICLALFLTTLLTLAPCAAGFSLAEDAEPPPVRQVGILQDGPWWRAGDIFAAMRTAILELTRGEFDVRFDVQETGDWTEPGVAAAADRLFAHPEVDVVLGLGPLAAEHLGRREALPKPTICPFALNPELSEFPRAGRGSGKENFNYIAVPTRYERDLTIFRELVRFDELVILVNQPIWDASEPLRRNLLGELGEKPYATQIVPIRDEVGTFLESLEESTDAVYLSPLVLLDEAEFGRLAAGLADRGLPSFSMFGRHDVEAGILASAAPPADYQRVARRVALHVQAALIGDPVSDLPVDFSAGERLTINMRTARAIGYRPSFAVLADAELLHEEARPSGPLLTLRDVAEEAVRVNLSLLAKARAVAAGEAAVDRVRAKRRPSAVAGLGGTVIDEDRASTLFSTTAEETASASLTLSQLIFSDPVNAEIFLEKRAQARRELDRRDLELEIAEAATVGYLDVLRARTLVRIEKDNLSLTRENLELARVRRDIGSAGPSEVLRWESELADARRRVIDAEAAESKARYSLNQILNRPLESPLNLADTTLENSGLLVNAEQVGRYVRDPWSFELLRDFFVEQALELSPAVRALDEVVASRERALKTAQRSFWAPEVQLSGRLTRILEESGEGADRRDRLALPGLAVELPDDTSWSVSVEATLPLVAGGRRLAALREAREGLDEARLLRRDAAEQVELAVRASLRDAGSTFSAIELSQTSADAARENLEVVSDAYSEGTLSILDLLDAQNAALTADQAAATAVYSHLIANLRVQRVVGEFDFFRDPEEVAAWLGSLEAYFEEAGFEVGE